MIRFTSFRAVRASRRIAAAVATAGGALALPGVAAAAVSTNTITSSNWSGYAAHGSGAKFDNVSGRWRVPAADCVQGEQTFSSFWVGIGGYDTNSTGLEQDGIELDCKSNGTESLSAWYELLPAGPHTLRLTVRTGDLIAASVHVEGTLVTIILTDRTRHESFSKTVRDSKIDDTTAEWIAEAPENCTSDTDCGVLPLADFRRLRFTDATATTTGGVTSGISTGHWTTSRLLLGYSKREGAFIAKSGEATATPSSLRNGNRVFAVTWHGSQSSTGVAGTGTGGSYGTGGTSGSSGTPNPGGVPGPGSADPGSGGGAGNGAPGSL